MLLLYPFVALAALGLVLVFAVQVAAFLGLDLPSQAIWLLPGLFVVWFPTVIAVQISSQDARRADLWKAALRGAPRWMRLLVYACAGYALLNLVVFVFFVRGSPGSSDNMMLRIATGHALPFYAAAFTALYSAIQIRRKGLIRMCPNGHTASFSAKYCEQCGQPIPESVE